MISKSTYPVWKHHESLRPVLSDLRFLDASMERATKDPDTTPVLCMRLLELRQIVIGSFWKLLYADSEFSDRYSLQLDLSVPEPVVHVLKEPDDATEDASNASLFARLRERLAGPDGEFWLG